ncbi:MAG: SDR family NAD(P)-dependent oxidoreductase, partial [Victivallaceae bacterium]
MSTSNLLKNKTILVAGANSLFGWQAAIACAESGGTIVALCRDSAKLGSLLKKLHNINECSHAVIEFDMAASELIPLKISKIIQEHGPIHGLIHAPGITTPCPFKAVKSPLLERLFRINVISAFELVQALAFHPQCPRDIKMIFASPVAAADYVDGMSAFAACRGALMSSTRLIASELAANNVRINYLIPSLLYREGHCRNYFNSLENVSDDSNVNEIIRRMASGI